jgi:hypothetical protein
MKKDTKAMIRKLRKQARKNGQTITVTTQGKGDHRTLYLNGQRITTLGHAPSPVNMRNTRAQIRRRIAEL